MRRHWATLLLPALVEAPRSFDATYTIVNKASGRRMFASPQAGLFVVDDGGPIYTDQMWLLGPQDNQSYAIINAANGLRVVAQAGADGANGFFAIDNGPVYQDQTWRLHQQNDGSYAIVNAKSGRRISARTGEYGKLQFAAIASSGPIEAEETWWIINQERDETARLITELEVSSDSLVRLAEEAAQARNHSGELTQRLRSTLDRQRRATDEAKSWKRDALQKMSQLQAERYSTIQLTAQIDKQQRDLARLQEDLSTEQFAKQKLAAEVQTFQEEHVQRKSELKAWKAAQRRLAEQLKERASEGARLALQLRKERDTRQKVGEELVVMREHVENLTAELDEASVSNQSLAVRLQTCELSPRCWISALQADFKNVLVIATTLAVIFVTAAAWYGRRHLGLLSEVRGNRKQIQLLEKELHAEFGDMVRVGDSACGLGSDFGYCIFNTEINQESVRLIKIQCPGVKHADVEVELVFNGCEVTIRRQASRGVAGTIWRRKFQFRPSDGLFEFREEQMLLEDGFLQLVFRACGFQNRLVLFPRHFSLSDSDADACWDYAADYGAEQGDEVEAWWNDAEEAPRAVAVDAALTAAAGKPCSQADVDTESTASTARGRL